MRHHWMSQKIKKQILDAFKTKIQANDINHRNQPIHIPHQNEPYVYLGIKLVPLLKWKL